MSGTVSSSSTTCSNAIKEALAQTHALRCLSCGKCTAVCPVAYRGSDFSPRALVESVLAQATLVNSQVAPAVWVCLTCGRCVERCNSGVDYPALIRELRALTSGVSETPLCARGAAVQSISQIAIGRPQRKGWLGPGLRVASRSDVLLFVGCLPYFDPLVREVGARPLDIARGTVKILNALGIEPCLLPSEACCGHDLLWAGDKAGFQRVAEHNLRQIRDSGVDVIVTPCPECYQTLKVEYAQSLGGVGVEVLHLSEFLAKRIGELPIRCTQELVVTYHDPCRLGRFSGLYDQPRQILSAIPGLEIVEMSKSRAMAECCGAHAWNNCGALAKKTQLDILREAESTGASFLVTACPKCEIHFNCATRRDDADTTEAIRLRVRDLFSLVADALA